MGVDAAIFPKSPLHDPCRQPSDTVVGRRTVENRALQADVLYYLLGAIGLGVTGLAFGELGQQWQGVPPWVPLRAPLAYFSAIVLLAAGCAALRPRWLIPGLAALGIFFATVALLLKTAAIARAPLSAGAWLGFAEIFSLAIAAYMAVLTLRGTGRPRIIQSLSVGYGLCVINFGMCHFAYADITASMVPEWLPERYFWAYLTGLGHLTAGLALVSGVLVRLAARMLGVMMGSFALLVHLPDVLADPSSHTAWTLQFISLALAGAAWLVGGVLARQEANRSMPSLWKKLSRQLAPDRAGV